MTRIFTPQKRLPLIRYLLVLTVLAAVAGSCTTNDYQTPAMTSTPTALITPETLKSWIDAGKVNGTGYDRVVKSNSQLWAGLRKRNGDRDA